MPRIPEAELAQIKQQVSLLVRVRAAGIELQRHGADWIGRCPFHDDSNPSLVITPAKNLWHCLGACQAGGSVIDWVMRVEGVSFRHAVERLRAEVPGLDTPTIRFDATMDDAALLDAVVTYYHATLLTSAEPIAYLEHRGLNHRTAIEQFQLGYANRTLTYQLPDGKPGTELRMRLQALGIFRASGHEHLNGSLVIPIRDTNGQVSELYGRKLRDDLRPGTPVHLYLPGPHRGVWNRAAVVQSTEIILCEALLDALTFWCAGFPHVTASYGIQGCMDELAEACTHDGIERVLIAYDRDDAGDHAAEQLATRLTAQGVRCYRVQFPRGMDANAFARENPPAAQSLGLALRHAVFLGQGAPTAPLTEAANKKTTAAPLAASRAHTPPPASPEPPTPPPDVPVTLDGDDVNLTLGDRTYRVRGLQNNTAPEVMKVNLLVRKGEQVHVDTLDLYAARPRAQYAQQASKELRVDRQVVTKDLGTILLRCERLQGEGIVDARGRDDERVTMSPAARAAALEVLRDPQLIARISADFERVGVVGEATNALVGYLAALSRKLPEPLAVIVQSGSAAGKTALMDAVLAFVPPRSASSTPLSLARRSSTWPARSSGTKCSRSWKKPGLSARAMRSSFSRVKGS